MGYENRYLPQEVSSIKELILDIINPVVPDKEEDVHPQPYQLHKQKWLYEVFKFQQANFTPGWSQDQGQDFPTTALIRQWLQSWVEPAFEPALSCKGVSALCSNLHSVLSPVIVLLLGHYAVIIWFISSLLLSPLKLMMIASDLKGKESVTMLSLTPGRLCQILALTGGMISSITQHLALVSGSLLS